LLGWGLRGRLRLGLTFGLTQRWKAAKQEDARR